MHKKASYGNVRWLVGNLHVSLSDKGLIREFYNRLKSNPANMTTDKRADRKELYRYALETHHENQALYRDVMSGSL